MKSKQTLYANNCLRVHSCGEDDHK